jgi:hypothetical protein
LSLDVNKLTNVRQIGDKTIAACPACREDQQDLRGEHLFISKDGRFGCVVHRGWSQAARAHRRRIWKLAGVSGRLPRARFPKRVIVERPVAAAMPTRILGRFGRSSPTHAHTGQQCSIVIKSKKEASEPSENGSDDLVITAYRMFHGVRFELRDHDDRPSESGSTVSHLKRVLARHR